MRRLTNPWGKGQDRGFTLLELLIVVLIVGILAAVAVPIYLGYNKDAKTAEGKTVAGSLWASLQGQAMSSCNSSTAVSAAYPKAGIETTTATTIDGRWKVNNATSLTVDCSSGSYTVTNPIFQLDGQKTDIDFIHITMSYDTTKSPASFLQCDVGQGLVNC